MKNLRLLVSAISLCGATLASAGVVVHLEAGSSAAALKPPFAIDAQRVDKGAFGPTQTFHCASLGECVVDVKEGSWVFSSGSDAVYAHPRSVTVTASASTAPTVTLQLYPAATVSGVVKVPDTPTPVSLHFRGEGDAALSDRARCTTEERRFSCFVPVGTWDVRIGVAGHVPRYLSAFDVRADKANSVGTLQFVRGASLTGRIEIERGFRLENAKDIRVTLSPAAAVRTAGQRRDVTMTARPNAKGFFHFAGVPPGDYTVRAVAPGAVTETQIARIVADREAELRRPLVLAVPKRVTVYVTPALAPSGKPWRIALARRELDDRIAPVTEAATDVNGVWEYRAASPGAYVVSVHDDARGTFATRDAEVTQDVDLALLIQLTRLTGELRLGDKPVGGKVTFAGMSGAEVAMPVEDDGTFEGVLPAAQSADWTVTVDSPSFGIHRELRDVRPAYDSDGNARVLLTLPNGQIGGKVVREDGTAMSYGWVNVTSGDGTEVLMQPRIQSDGRFTLNGLPDGQYSLQAEAVVERQSLQSDVVIASLREGTGDEVTLTLRRDRHVRGIVLSQSAPVIGATVVVAPTDVAWLFTAPRTTDPRGRFETLLPNSTREVDVFVKAAGFTKRLFHARLGKDDLNVRLAQTGGELRITLPHWSPDDPRAPQPWLLHDGAIVHARMMGRDEWEEKRVTIDAGQVDPGLYTLCLATNEQKPQMRTGNTTGLPCATAIVPPYGQAELHLGSSANAQ